MVKYNKIDDGAKEAIIRVLKKKSKLSGGSETKNFLLDIEKVLSELNKQVNEDELQEIATFVSEKMNIFKNDFKKDAELPLVVLYYFFPKLDDNTEEGFKQRKSFIETAKKHDYMSYTFNAETAENGLINEIAFIDVYFPNKKDELLPGLSKLLSGDISFDPIDFIIDSVPIEVKSLSYCSNKSISGNPKPQYGIEKSKLKNVMNANPSHSVVVFPEQCSTDWRLNNRNASIEWKYIILDNSKYKLIKELGLYTEAYSQKANKYYDYFAPPVVKELQSGNQLFNSGEYDKYLKEQLQPYIELRYLRMFLESFISGEFEKENGKASLSYLESQLDIISELYDKIVEKEGFFFNNDFGLVFGGTKNLFNDFDTIVEDRREEAIQKEVNEQEELIESKLPSVKKSNKKSIVI